MTKLFLKEIDEHDNDFKNEKIYYNCDKKKYITSKCFKFKQKTFKSILLNIFNRIFKSSSKEHCQYVS